MAGASVGVSALESDGSWVPLGSGTSRADGSFSIDVADHASELLAIVVTGGSYVSPFDGRMVQATGTLTALIEPAQAGQPIVVTPLSDMVAARVLVLLPSMRIPQALSQARGEVQALFGLQSPPEVTVPSFDGAAAYAHHEDEPHRVALALVSVDTLSHQASPTDPDAIAGHLSEDFSDGRLDGRNHGAPISYGDAGEVGADDLKAMLFSATESSITAVASGVSPAGVQTWAEKNPEQAIDDGIVKTAPGYSCGAGYELVNDRYGHPTCWDGTVAADGTPLIGLYTVCSANGDKVADGASCPKTSGYSCPSGYRLLQGGDGRVTCWDGTTTVTGAPIVGSYTICAADNSKVTDAKSCPPSSLINASANSTTIAIYAGATVNALANSTEIALFTAPTIAQIQAVAVTPIPAADWSGISASGFGVPSYLSSSGGLTADQLSWYNTINQDLIQFYSY